MWILFAFGSALFAGLTSILAKCGIRKTDSDTATAIRTIVVLLFSWLMVAIVGSAPTITGLSAKTWVFLILSGLATGASWLCYFRALQLGDVNKVVPIDKSSTALTVLLAVVLFGEVGHLTVKLAATAVILAGTFLMIERKEAQGADAPEGGRRWLMLAVLSAVFAALTSVLAKIGIERVDSSLATAVRTCFVLVMAWGIVAARGKLGLVRATDRRELGFICASGVATGASWLFYYRALQEGPASVVVPIDKLSMLVTIAFSWIVFHEKLTKKSAVGVLLITAGTLLLAVTA